MVMFVEQYYMLQVSQMYSSHSICVRIIGTLFSPWDAAVTGLAVGLQATVRREPSTLKLGMPMKLDSKAPNLPSATAWSMVDVISALDMLLLTLKIHVMVMLERRFRLYWTISRLSNRIVSADRSKTAAMVLAKGI